jgi:hypothetical protein
MREEASDEELKAKQQKPKTHQNINFAQQFALLTAFYTK